MKKILAIALAVMLVGMSLVGCSTGDGGGSSKGAEIALITDKGNIDDKSFNQGSWEGVLQFAKAENITHQYIKPEDATDDDYLAAIDLAITGGAKVVVTPGFLFEVAIYEAQTKYPDVKFILLDGAPHTADYSVFETKPNVASIVYAEEQSGYLAGYAAVKDGMTDLGFMGGMAVPAVQAFGYGYLMGAEDAAEEMGLADGAIKALYHYTGDFAETDSNKATAKAMYQEGVEVIFACGGSVGKSVMSVVDVLTSIYKTDSFATYGGKTTVFNAENDGVGLPTAVIGDDKADAFDRFTSFDKAQYDELYAKMKAGDIKAIREIDVADPSGNATAAELTSALGLKKVKVETR